MKTHKSPTDVLPAEEEHASLKAYLIGFVLSIVFTLLAYVLVVNHVLQGWVLGASIGLLALLQATVQMIYFLHLGKEHKPHWNTLSFFFMFSVLVIIVLGTLWIMYSLDYRVMEAMDMDAMMRHKPGN